MQAQPLDLLVVVLEGVRSDVLHRNDAPLAYAI